MKLAYLRSFFTSMDGKSTVLFLRQFQGIYEEKPMGLFPGLLEPTQMGRFTPQHLLEQAIAAAFDDYHANGINSALARRIRFFIGEDE